MTMIAGARMCVCARVPMAVPAAQSGQGMLHVCTYRAQATTQKRFVATCGVASLHL